MVHDPELHPPYQVPSQGGFISAQRIVAGSISTGEFIESDNYDGAGEGSPGTEGWYIDGTGFAEFQNMLLRGKLSIPLGNGDTVEMGDTISSPGLTGTFHGITLDDDNENNFWGRKDDGSRTYFEVGNGTQYLRFDTAASPELQVKGDVIAETGQLIDLDITGTLDLVGSGILRTGSSGARLELTQSAKDRIKFYNTSGVHTGSIGVYEPISAVGQHLVLGAVSGTGKVIVAAGSSYGPLEASSFTAVGSGGFVQAETGTFTEVDGGFIHTNDLYINKTAYNDIWTPHRLQFGTNNTILGTQGSFRWYVAWNWTRTSSGFVSLSDSDVNNSNDAVGIALGDGGFYVFHDPSYSGSAHPQQTLLVAHDGSRYYGTGEFAFDSDIRVGPSDNNARIRNWSSLCYIDFIQSSGVDTIFLKADNQLASPIVYNNTTTSGANVHVTSSGILQRSTSSLRAKTDIAELDAEHANAVLRALRPITFRDRTPEVPQMEHWTHYGFGAEEVAAVDPRLAYHRFVPKVDADGNPVLGDDGVSLVPELGEDGQLQLIPEGVQFDRITALLVAVVQQLDRRIDVLEAARG